MKPGGSIALVDPSLLSDGPKAWIRPFEGRTIIRNNIVVDRQVEVEAEVEVEVGAKVVEDPEVNRQDDLLE